MLPNVETENAIVSYWILCEKECGFGRGRTEHQPRQVTVKSLDFICIRRLWGNTLALSVQIQWCGGGGLDMKVMQKLPVILCECRSRLSSGYSSERRGDGGDRTIERC